MSLFGILAGNRKVGPAHGGTTSVGHPLHGFLNMGTFEVRGINPITKKSNKRVFSAVDIAGAIKMGHEVGLIDPVTAIEIETEMATDSQLAYANNLGITVPLYATKIDVSALICRADDGDANAVSPSVVAKATASGVVMSTLSGPTLAKSVLK